MVITSRTASLFYFIPPKISRCLFDGVCDSDCESKSFDTFETFSMVRHAQAVDATGEIKKFLLETHFWRIAEMLNGIPKMDARFGLQTTSILSIP